MCLSVWCHSLDSEWDQDHLYRADGGRIVTNIAPTQAAVAAAACLSSTKDAKGESIADLVPGGPSFIDTMMSPAWAAVGVESNTITRIAATDRGPSAD